MGNREQIRLITEDGVKSWNDWREKNPEVMPDLEDIKNWNQIGGMESTNLFGVQNAPEGFLEWAKDQGAVIQE